MCPCAHPEGIWGKWFSVPGKGKRFLSSPKCQAFFAAHEVNCPVDTKARTLGVRWLGQEPDLSSPFTVNVKKKKRKKNMLGVISPLPPYTCMAQCLIMNRNILFFPFFFLKKSMLLVNIQMKHMFIF